MVYSFSNSGSLLLSLSLMLRPTVSRPACLAIKHPSGAYDPSLLLSEICGCVDVGRYLRREDGSLIYNCCRSSSAQSFLGMSPVSLVTIFSCLSYETSLCVASYDSQGHGGGIRHSLHTGWISTPFEFITFITARRSA
jgi:hypothetical protein